MDSSPRPLRRFSRWQTTKRPFVIGGVTYIPESAKSTKQNQAKSIAHGHGKSARKDKNYQNDILNHSKGSSKQTGSLTKPSHVRQLHLESDLLVGDRNQMAKTGPDKKQKETVANNALAHSESSVIGEDRQQQDKDKTMCDTRAEGNALSPTQPSTNTTDKIASTEDVDNKIALSSISQNTFANKSSVQTRSSALKTHAVLHDTNMGADQVTSESSRRKRTASDDGESSDSSSTDKENKDKESKSPDSASPAKKSKIDEKRKNLSSPNVNKSCLRSLNISERNEKNESFIREENVSNAASSKRFSLRNRNQLISAETLLKSRQYPVTINDCSINSEKKISPSNNTAERKKTENRSAPSSKEKKSKRLRDTNTSREISKKASKPTPKGSEKIQHVKDGSQKRKQSRLPRPKVTQNKSSTLKTRRNSSNEVNGITSTAIEFVKTVAQKVNHQGKTSSLKATASGMKTDKHSYERSQEMKKQNKTAQSNKSLNASKTREIIGQLSKSDLATNPVAHIKTTLPKAQTIESSSEKRSLRDRSLLPTPESLQNLRQYPIAYFYSSKKLLDVSKTSSVNHRKSSAQQMEKKQSAVSSQSQQGTSLASPEERDKQNKSINNKSSSSMGPHENRKKGNSSVADHPSDRTALDLPVKQTQQRSTKHKVVHISKRTSKVPQKIQHDCSRNKLNSSRNDRKSNRTLNHSSDLGNKSSSVDKNLQHSSAHRKQSIINDTVYQRTRSKQQKVNGATSRKNLRTTSTSNSGEEFAPAIGDSFVEFDTQSETGKTSGRLKEKGDKNERTSSLFQNAVLSKPSRKQWSLPRQPGNKNRDCDFAATARQSDANKMQTVFQRPPQLSGTIVDHRQTPKVAQRKPIEKPFRKGGGGTSNRTNEAQVQVQKLNTSINETLVLSQKPPRKRKLVEDLEKADLIVSQSDKGQKAESQTVMLWCGEGQSRPGSDVTAFDVILQAVMDTEKQISDEVEDELVSHRLVDKVMGRLKRRIRPMITKVKEVKALQKDIRKRKSTASKLMTYIAEQQKRKARLRTEIETQVSSDQDADMIRISEWMKGYSQLMGTLSTRQMKET